MSVAQATDLDRVTREAPECLRRTPQWVCWKSIERDGRPTKCPVNPHTGAPADSTDRATWGAFDDAIAACRRSDELAGVGFVFSPDDPFCGVDLDDSLDPDTGLPKPWAQEIIGRLASYTEISPSGQGVKVFLRAAKPGPRCRKAHHDGEVEMYDRGRFFTVTGRRLAGVPSDVQQRDDPLRHVYREVFGEDGQREAPAPEHPPPGAGGRAPLDDDEILRLASGRRRGGEKFSALWAGRWNDHFNSRSEADASVVFTLAFYTKDAAQLDRLFRRSGLMRPKWDERHGERTYGEMTIAKALSKVTRQYNPKHERKKPKSPRPAAPPPRDPGLPAIPIDDTQLSDLTAKALDALAQANTPPSVFVRSGALSRVVRDENGLPKIEPYDRVRMRCRLAEVANFFTLRKGEKGYEPVGTNPPLSLAENVLALGDWSFPPLAGIARAPILRHDGTICTRPGYDAVSRLVYCPDPGLTLSPIAEHPNLHEVHACADILLDLISDFPFADEPSRANALAILFSILMRPVIAGHVPLAIVDAPVQGTGKTLLVTTLATIATGSVAVESIPAKQNDDEWRKKITSILLAAGPFVLLDNIPDNTTIDSASLAAALTTHEWSDRLLGRNDTIRLPSRAVWAATGNNLRVAGDMPRRSFNIRLDANAERPWQRTGFKIAGLQQHALDHRGDLLSAALTIIRAWYTHGRPRANVPTLGSFEQWAETIGGVLALAGIDGFLANLDRTQLVQDEDTPQWTAFFDAWWDALGETPVTVEELSQQILSHGWIDDGALPDALVVHRDRGEGALRRSLGRHLSRLAGRIFNGHKLTDAGNDRHRKVRCWRLAGLLTPQETNNPADFSLNPATEREW